MAKENKKEETKQIAWENVELQNFLLTMLGFDMPNVYTNCIYKVLFGMNAKQLREKIWRWRKR